MGEHAIWWQGVRCGGTRDERHRALPLSSEGCAYCPHCGWRADLVPDEDENAGERARPPTPEETPSG